MSNISYKVLWVEDKEQEVDFFQTKAELYNIELIWLSNWQEAKKELENNFNEFSAIILDAHCKLSPQEMPTPHFLGQVKTDLGALYAVNQCSIPWYVLSAGTMENFGYEMESAGISRKGHEEWGEFQYLKDAPEDDPHSFFKLFEQIVTVAKNQPYYTIRTRFEDVFKYMGEGKLLSTESKKTLQKWLCAIYFPNKVQGFEYNPTNLRKIVENLFNGLYNHGLLSDKWETHIMEKISLDSFVYDLDKLGVLPDNVHFTIINIYHLLNTGSHDKSKDEKSSIYDNSYLKDYKEMLSGCVFQLCYIIRYLGHYVEEHPDIKANKKMAMYCPKKEDNKKNNRVS